VSNVSRFKIIESTLREGEQFANAFFDTGRQMPGFLQGVGADIGLQRLRSRCTRLPFGFPVVH